MIVLPNDLKDFFDDYRAAFSQGPAAIAEFYYEPCITARQGVVVVNSSHQDTTNLFARVDEQYRSRGYTHADYEPLDVKLLGANGAFATIEWSYKDANEKTIWRTTFSYNLYSRNSIWKILVQTMHD
jgi:hypothetical protein